MKELPYFKFFTAEWLSGDITLCSLAAQGAFVNICALYWRKDGDLKLTSVIRRYNEPIVNELIEEGIFVVEDDKIIIKFLDEQFVERRNLSEQNRQNVLKRHKKVTSVNERNTDVNERNTTLYNKELELEKEKKESRGKTKRFTPPSKLEIYEYFIEKTGSQKIAKTEGEKFWNYYESNGWHVGKNKMKDWQAAIRNWVARNDLKPEQRTGQIIK